jgi:manganese/zinc/iron transport system substrate-binding protein
MQRCWLVVVLLLIAGCRETSPDPPGDRRLHVVCTTGMIGDLARRIGGDEILVTDLFKPGVDPHTYRPTTDDLTILNRAGAVLYNGLHLEGKMDTVLEKLNARMPSLPVGELLFDHEKTVPLLKNDEGHPDPHVWFDVRLWSAAAQVVGDALVKHDAAHAEIFRQRTDTYRARLAKLHEDTRADIATIPGERRVLVTSHDAFRYFGRAYAIEVRGVQGINTEAEASVRDITGLVDFLATRKVKAVFVESSVNPRNMRSLIEGCAARGHTVSVGGELFSDAMGDPGTPDGTYEGMIRHNVATMLKALR